MDYSCMQWRLEIYEKYKFKNKIELYCKRMDFFFHALRLYFNLHFMKAQAKILLHVLLLLHRGQINIPYLLVNFGFF